MYEAVCVLSSMSGNQIDQKCKAMPLKAEWLAESRSVAICEVLRHIPNPLYVQLLASLISTDLRLPSLPLTRPCRQAPPPVLQERFEEQKAYLGSNNNRFRKALARSRKMCQKEHHSSQD